MTVSNHTVKKTVILKHAFQKLNFKEYVTTLNLMLSLTQNGSGVKQSREFQFHLAFSTTPNRTLDTYSQCRDHFNYTGRS